MKQIRKFIEFEVKEVEGEDRTLSAVASTGAKDRDGDIIEPSGWKLKNFRKNPVIMWAHEYRGTGALPIGNAPEIKIEDDRLKFKVKFIEKEIYPFAETVFQMYKKRYLRTFSVGFIPIKSEDIEDDEDKDKKGMFSGRRFTSQELLEISGCPVPSNVEAMAERGMKDVMAKSFGLDNPNVEDETNLKKGEMIFESLFPHHNEANGDIVPEKVIACMGALLGARGGIDLEFNARVIIYNHLVKHYESMKKEAPEFKDYTEPELREMFNEVWFEELGDIITLEMKRKDEEAEAKSGRVLSEKNRSLVKKCIDVLTEVYNASEPKEDEEGKEVFNCECIKCGHKMKSKKHCNDIKCPKCGGQMRRAERPGPGREINEEDNKTLESIGKDLAEIEKQIKG